MASWKKIWIADYSNIDSIREKIGSKHGIDIDDFVLQTKVNKNLFGEEGFSIDHGLRTVIEVKLSNGKRIRAYIDLIDADFDIWSIRTVRYID